MLAGTKTAADKRSVSRYIVKVRQGSFADELAVGSEKQMSVAFQGVSLGQLEA